MLAAISQQFFVDQMATCCQRCIFRMLKFGYLHHLFTYTAASLQYPSYYAGEGLGFLSCRSGVPTDLKICFFHYLNFLWFSNLRIHSMCYLNRVHFLLLYLRQLIARTGVSLIIIDHIVILQSKSIKLQKSSIIILIFLRYY